MRLILFFDLPSIKQEEKRRYSRFVKDIKKMGYYMLQESVYLKLCSDTRSADSFISQVREVAPKEGSVAILKITEKQFAEIDFIIGDHYSDVISGEDRIIEL